MTSRFVSTAEEELADAASFYENKRIGLGDEFFAAIQSAVDQLEKLPSLGTAIDSDYRLFVIRRFPYSLIYRIANDEFVSVAVAHQSRKPGYWSGRVD